MCRFATQIPQEGGKRPRNGRGDVWRRITQVERENLGIRRRGQQTLAEREDASAVAGGTFGKDYDNSVFVSLENGVKTHKVSIWWRCLLRGEKGT
jgi:hypothetical protein